MTIDELKAENESLKTEIKNLREALAEMASEYEGLMDDSLKLTYLEGFGVDNWDGYDDAMEAYANHTDE